jgi:hypothetical protein
MGRNSRTEFSPEQFHSRVGRDDWQQIQLKKELMDFQTESAIFQIFGQPLGVSAAHEQQQADLRKADRVHDDFFSQAEIEHLTGRRAQRTTPLPTVPELQRAIGIETEDQPGTFTKSLERPLLVNDRFGQAARKLIGKEIRLRRTLGGSEISITSALESAWNAFSQFANPWQKTQAAQAIKECDSAVVQALLREAMCASEGEL